MHYLTVLLQSGVGKSSLINECFGVNDATVSHSGAGVSNINTPIIASENGRFVLHDSQGFEHGEGENFQKVVDFLKARKNMPNVRDQVHAVWLCFQVSLSEGDRLFEAGVEELFRMKSEGELGPVPVITVFTKYDRLVTQVRFGNNMEFMRRTKTLDPDARNALLVKETNERFETLCVRPFRAVVGPDVPHIAVSTKKEYNDSTKSLKDLTALTAKYVKECLAVEVAEEVAVLSAVAQRVNPAMKIDAVIAIGKKRYWRGLASSANFPGKTIEACLRVLHTDIVRVWNIQDEFGHLESKEFRALMATLAGEQYEELLRASPVLAALIGLIGGLSGPAAPIVIPIAATAVLGKWVYDVYQQSALMVQRLMAYIVDFTIIMQVIFGLVINARLRLSRRLIKLAFAAYNNSIERRQVHNEIKEHVKSAGRTDRDAALAMMLQLIKDRQIKTEDIDKAMEGFDNDEDEHWDVLKA
ncbi:hypothetical protein K443DRAFT_6597 [Laccaria amethystina LaAM-08-1]|uniref:G domain-containing protein n=1 Tax=Laccaria amethystina LaAM-08-1 TaxID=1095629 RepID=A0A0C9X9Y7_9AGAR|nr:hypothetical protein K443DRAFT_6597 [Laccaria amethystina LaAM-08-1]